MGKKYIVELGRCERLYKAYINGNGKPNITWLSPEVDLTPYTEPDLEQVRKEAYQKGYETGYEDGYNEPGKNQQEAYQRGLSDAWDAATKILKANWGERNGMFGAVTLLEDIFLDNTPAEAIEKIRQYEQRQEEQIKVGDEVNAPFGKAIVVNIDSVAKKIWLVYADGHGGFEYFKDAPTKTGRHFPEIAAVLEKMREGQDG